MRDVINEARQIIRLFPREHNDRDPFRVLIKTVLSQRTRDENTDRAAEKLFSVVDTPEKLSTMDEEEIGEYIKASGMYRQKAKRIKEISKILVEKYKGKVPDKLEELIKLPGVGRKTANIVLSVAFKKPAIAVDVHVHRISNRLGWVKTKTPYETELELMKLLPEELWLEINGSMVEFGRKICKPQRPLCDQCPLKEKCLYNTKGKEERK